MAKGITGLILAGGYSRRFGTDKARYSVGGRSMIERVAGAVSLTCDSVIVSLGTDTDGFDLSGLTNVRNVRDRFCQAGPLAGIHAGLETADTPWLLAVACDMPYLNAEALQTLLDERTSTSRVVVATDRDGRLHPLCACYRRDTLPVIVEQLNAGRRSLHALLERLDPMVTVRLPDRALRNINTPADLPGSDPEIN